eukprot:TRINITY_DN2815_c0_g1_i22.p2 TRINITY_DN2815_c0_g1~~TRINITY_DN2815_c0_g1_i22.p2  ORF type:complete len:218 (-),score=4.89 TRINITY_DN2815_c0_g1_i22:1110-1763(-)
MGMTMYCAEAKESINFFLSLVRYVLVDPQKLFIYKTRLRVSFSQKIIIFLQKYDQCLLLLNAIIGSQFLLFKLFRVVEGFIFFFFFQFFTLLQIKSLVPTIVVSLFARYYSQFRLSALIFELVCFKKFLMKEAFISFLFSNSLHVAQQFCNAQEYVRMYIFVFDLHIFQLFDQRLFINLSALQLLTRIPFIFLVGVFPFFRNFCLELLMLSRFLSIV